MRVLVTAASRHGATGAIAGSIAATIAEYGIDVETLPPQQVSAVDGFDAVVLGSAVYMGGWMPAARSFVDRFETSLADMPVWVFSSGPIGDPPRPDEQPPELVYLATRIRLRQMVTFPGALDRTRLGLRERIVMRLFRAPAGDFRPWDDVRQWARAIAHELHDAESRR